MIIVKDREVSKEGEIWPWVLKKQGYQMVRGRKNRETGAEVQYQAAYLNGKMQESSEVPGRRRPLSSESPAPKAEPGAQ